MNLRCSWRITVSPPGTVLRSECPISSAPKSRETVSSVLPPPEEDDDEPPEPRPQPAQDEDEADEDREPEPHATVTFRGHDRTMPSCSAVSRYRPAAGATTWAAPDASVTAVAEPSRTVAPATGTPSPLSS